MKQPKINLLFEVSWEVCNKVGGIYTVLSSKAKMLKELYGDNLIFIGPDLHTDTSCFIEDPRLLSTSGGIEKLPYGITVKTGRWNIPGSPRVVLVDFNSLYSSLPYFYGEMWKNFGVDSLHAYGDYDEACAFSIASAIVIGAFSKTSVSRSGKIIAHFNEWTTGMGLLYIRQNFPNIATVFTAHATCMGRSICGNGKPLYDYLEGYNGDQMARELNMESKHSLEKAAAGNADCFTTVSEVTGIEARQLLEKYPDIVTPNGFEISFVPEQKELKKTSSRARKKLLEVASCLKGRKYLRSTYLIATSGRCEYRNKGLDVFLDSIAKLKNQERKSRRDIVAFVMVPAWLKESRNDLQEALKNGTVTENADRYLTHWICNYNDDAILSRIRELNFSSSDAEGTVDVIYVPCYLNGNDGIFNMSYYDLLTGFDATVFPSYYEPWGYTPLESVAFGIPTVTTSLSGFGQWVDSLPREKGIVHTGVEVIKRTDSNYHEVVGKIADTLSFLEGLSKKDIAGVGKAARATADKAEWSNFIKYYTEAFGIALLNCRQRNKTEKKKTEIQIENK